MPIASTGTAFHDSQREVILTALRTTGWVVGGPRGAAARLGLKRTTLITKMNKLGISRPVQQKDVDQIPQGPGEHAPVASGEVKALSKAG